MWHGVPASRAKQGRPTNGAQTRSRKSRVSARRAPLSTKRGTSRRSSSATGDRTSRWAPQVARCETDIVYGAETCIRVGACTRSQRGRRDSLCPVAAASPRCARRLLRHGWSSPSTWRRTAAARPDRPQSGPTRALPGGTRSVGRCRILLASRSSGTLPQMTVRAPATRSVLLSLESAGGRPAWGYTPARKGIGR